MTPVVAIVEGYGDFQAVPALIAKIGVALELGTIAPNPNRAGEWKALLQPGKLEKNLDLAATRAAAKIVVILDLDDGCEKQEQECFDKRVEAWKNGREIDVQIVFFVREYETLFLQCPKCLSNFDEEAFPTNPLLIRGAKERIKKLIGRRYRETQDQLLFTKQLDLKTAFEKK